MKGDPLRSQNHDELKSSMLGPTNNFFFKVFFRLTFFFSGTKKKFQGTTFVQAKKNFGVIRKFLKIFDFQKSLGKLGPTMEDFHSS